MKTYKFPSHDRIFPVLSLLRFCYPIGKLEESLLPQEAFCFAFVVSKLLRLDTCMFSLFCSFCFVSIRI